MNHISSLTDSYWITSYDNVPEITDLYSAFRNNVYSLSYTANIKYKGKEVMFFSDNLKLNKELLNISFKFKKASILTNQYRSLFISF